jgi:two-component system, NtrC family, response regulator AtoC
MPVDRNQSYRIDAADLPGEAVIFGRTPAMREIRSKLVSVLSNDLPVVIQGESGTGKGIIARFLHIHAKGAEAPFVKLNCAAIPRNLLESELFGYEKGSFTGANKQRIGLVEIAEGGTLFLDEIGELHWDLQSKLLHLLQDATYTRIGGTEERQPHVRVVCATDSDLRAAVQAGKFREDLYYRIDIVTLRLSALRDRKDDIPQLCEYFLEKLARKFGRPAPQLSSATLQLLQEWNWPGNMRELENWIARAIILGDDEALGAELRRQVAANIAVASRLRPSGPLKEASRHAASAASNALILRALEANNWNRRKTANALNMSYRSLLYKLREVGIPQRRKPHKSFPPAG